MIEIVYLSKDVVVVNKPFGMPSQSDRSGDLDALVATEKKLGEMAEETALWLVHRLDRVVGGLLIFARNKKTAARLSLDVQHGGISKYYLAVTEGVAPVGELCDFIYKDARLGRSFVATGGAGDAKRACLVSRLIASRVDGSDTRSLVSVDLKTGRFHQIRTQLSHRGAPIFGDKKYGAKARSECGIGLFAYKVAFRDNGAVKTVVALPSGDVHPWSLFNIKEIDLEKI